MKITILCSSPEHPINAHLQAWMNKNALDHEVELVRQKSRLQGGDLLFLISCNELVTRQERALYKKTLLIHASPLPEGRGWSPHIWQILEGKQDIPVTLLEAEDKVDSGAIWHQMTCHIASDSLWNEINNALFAVELSLMDYAVQKFHSIHPRQQRTDIAPTYYPRRSPADSELDPELSIVEQFNLIRTCDPNRFPAFFKLHGKTYKLILEKLANE